MHIKRLPSILQVFAAALGGAMVLWWAKHGISQARRIAELELLLGLDKIQTERHLMRMERMFFWETGVFLALFLGLSAFLIIQYAREQKRTLAVQAFFAGVTHELRTPLTSIRLQAESIADRIPSEPKLIKRLLEDTLRLENQVERTLELARVEGGGQLQTELMDLLSWLKHWVTRTQEQYGESVELKMNSQLTPEQLNLAWSADRVRLEMVIRNLIDNSIKHSGVSKPVVSIEVLIEDKQGKLIISDNGKLDLPVGQKLGQLFEKGSQSGGAGVGLYLCKRLIHAMGGKINFSLSAAHGFRTEIFLKVDEHG